MTLVYLKYFLKNRKIKKKQEYSLQKISKKLR
jgi:hypothetical protein